MEYTNPVSIADMFNRPTNPGDLPGAGQGALQGALQGQAANNANQFLNLSMQGQAEDLAKKQAENQEWARFGPLRQQEKEADISQKRAQTLLTGAEASTAHEKFNQLKASGELDKINFIGQYADGINEAVGKGDIGSAQAQYEHLKQSYKNTFRADIDPSMESFDPQKTPMFLNKSKQLGVYADRQLQMHQANTAQEYGFKGSLQSKEITSQESIAKAKVDVEREIANLHSKTQIEVANIQSKNHIVSLQKEVIDALSIPEKQRDGRQQALVSMKDQIFGDALYKALAGGAGKAAGVQGMIQGLKDPNSNPVENVMNKGPRGQQPGYGVTKTGTEQNPHQPQTEQDFSGIKQGEFYIWQGQKYKRGQ